MSIDEDELRRQQGIETDRRTSDRFGPDWMDFLLEAADDIPADWLEMTPQEQFDHLRCRLQITQRELSRRSGVAQSQISRLLTGDDAHLSTWQRLYAGLGVKLVLVPLAPGPLHELEQAQWPQDGSRARTAMNVFRQMMARRKARQEADRREAADAQPPS